MWEDYPEPELIAEVSRTPVPMLLIAGAADWNTPVPLVRVCFETVETPPGQRMEDFGGSGYAPFQTETDRFMETERSILAGLAAETIE